MEVIEDEFDLAGFTTLAGGEPRQGEFSGTKALMLAVLEDGIRSYLGSGSRAAQEAEHWVRSARRHSPFSFVVVCETLNLNPDAVRRVLARLRDQRLSPRQALPRARPNVRMTGRLCTRRRH
ncbi:MAG TPA: hypothetical protein VMW17_17835 [Candidatus Binatia bacterium]|nr:hypothetical protein [Candidatus Binatia bacterium]